ncbi:hypothetical protein FB45DRAFT_1004704 [Roridomyces roridus]|uniref:Uncharacterized protein n=1 Tax=Roridomyces roridus TaxID=1738132 RepID=A0AAD7BQM5_9AGAR|nr:hypothetical protein FB45DRAFT_1004704 [Roridomyces roridus]
MVPPTRLCRCHRTCIVSGMRACRDPFFGASKTTDGAISMPLMQIGENLHASSLDPLKPVTIAAMDLSAQVARVAALGSPWVDTKLLEPSWASPSSGGSFEQLECSSRNSYRARAVWCAAGLLELLRNAGPWRIGEAWVARAARVALLECRSSRGDHGGGAFIKKLRVEGGFGLCMYGILKYAPKITDIFLSLYLHACDSVSGLDLGLPLINPRRLIVGEAVHAGPLKNKPVTQLMRSLEGLALTWNNLTTFISPNLYLERRCFIKKIIFTPNVQTLSFPLVGLHEDGAIPVHILEFARMTSIQKVEIRMSISHEEAERSLSHPTTSECRSKLQIVDHGLDVAPKYIPGLPINPAFNPLLASPQATVDLVWERVLFFAMHPVAVTGPTLIPACMNAILGHKDRTNKRRLQYLLVCKTFHVRTSLSPVAVSLIKMQKVALEYCTISTYLYRWPVLTPTNADALHQRLTQKTSLLREITIFSVAWDTRLTCEMLPLFTHTPNLTRLGLDDAVNMDWAVFRTVAEILGASLVELSVKVVLSAVPDAAVFCRFTALRKLTWASGDILIPPSQHASGGLPALECLVLEDHCHRSILPSLMPTMELQHVEFQHFNLDCRCTSGHLTELTNFCRDLITTVVTTVLNATLARRTVSDPAPSPSSATSAHRCTPQAYHVPLARCHASADPHVSMPPSPLKRSLGPRPTPCIPKLSTSAAAAQHRASRTHWPLATVPLSTHMCCHMLLQRLPPLLTTRHRFGATPSTENSPVVQIVLESRSGPSPALRLTSLKSYRSSMHANQSKPVNISSSRCLYIKNSVSGKIGPPAQLVNDCPPPTLWPPLLPSLAFSPHSPFPTFVISRMHPSLAPRFQPNLEVKINVGSAKINLELSEIQHSSLTKTASLPEIRHVIFPSYPSVEQTAEHGAFLKKHGSKILKLEIFTPELNKTLTMCPNLICLHINLGQTHVHVGSLNLRSLKLCLRIESQGDELKAYTETFDTSRKHDSLVKLVFDKARHFVVSLISFTVDHIYFTRQNQRNERADWNKIFLAIAGLQSAKFPALREVRCTTHGRIVQNGVFNF